MSPGAVGRRSIYSTGPLPRLLGPWAHAIPRGGREKTLDCPRRVSLGKQLEHDTAVHVRQPEIAALVAVSQTLVVDAEQMHQRCLQVVDVDAVLDDVVGEVVRLAVAEAAFHAAACQHVREAPGVMVAAPRRPGELALCE